jgi:Flp pilus assembly protein TadD
VEALRMRGENTAARELEHSLPAPSTPSDKYLEGVRLISGHPFVLGLPAEALRPLLGQTSSTARLPSVGKDVLVEYRDRARRAISLLSDAMARENRAIYHFALAWAAWIAGDEEIARRYSGSISEKWSEDPIARFYAALAREVYDATGALEVYAELLDEAPELWMVRQRRAELFLDRGDADAAIAEVEQLVAAAPDRISFRVSLAKLLYTDEQLDEAARVAQDVLDQDRTATEALDVLGLVQYAHGNTKAAIEHFRNAQAIEPNRAAFRNHLGWALLEEGDAEEALQHLEHARQLDEDDPFVAYNLGVAYGKVRNHQAALEQLEHALELHEEDPSPFMPRHLLLGAWGQALLDVGRAGEAVEALQEAIELEPDYAQHYSVLGFAAADAGLPDVCLGARERWLQMEKDTDDNHDALLVELKKRGYTARAFAAALRWTEAHSSSARAWNERAWLQSDPAIVPPLGDRADALRSAERALEIAGPDAYWVLDTLACAQFANGLVDEAIQNAVRAVDLALGRGASSDDVRQIEDHLARFDAAD